MRSTHLTALVLAAAACGPAPATQATFEAGIVDVLPCELEPQAAIPEAGQGTSFEIPLTALDEATVTLASPGGAWSAELLETPRRLRATVPYGAAGENAFVVQVSCRGKTKDSSVRVKVRPIRWGPGVTWAPGAGPSGREHPLMWVDARSPDLLWLFGGYTFVPAQFTVSTDLWSFDLKLRTWSSQASTGTLPTLAGGRSAVGGQPGQVWILGGSGSGNDVKYSLHALSAVEGAASFAPTAPDANGPQVSLGALVYDAPRDRLVSACGFTGTAIHCEVKARPASGADPKWEPLAVEGTPPSARYGFLHAHDAVNNRLILFSGAGYPKAGDPINAAPDTWALELDQTPARWVRLSAGRPDVPGRRNGCAALDTANNRFFVWSGTADGQNAVPGLHVLDLKKGSEGWTTLALQDAPTARGSCSAAYDPVRKQVLFGFGNDLAGAKVDLQPLEL